MNTSLSRRSFVSATAATALCVGAAAAPQAMATDKEVAPEPDYAAEVTETVDCDVVVVGSGVSGMAAGVQVAELGLKVLVIETSAIRGAVIRSTEGLAAVGSSFQDVVHEGYSKVFGTSTRRNSGGWPSTASCAAPPPDTPRVPPR